MIKKAFNDTVEWAKRDYRSHPIRFSLEVIAWMISIGCSLVMTITLPNPPLLQLYAAWVIGCAIYGWAAWTRNSFGMLANYLLLTTIDSIGLIKLIHATVV